MNYISAFYLAMAISAGAMLTVQSVFDVKFKAVYASQVPVAVMAFSLALAASLIWAWYSRESPFPSLQQMAAANWYEQIGGIPRVLYLIFIISAIPKIGYSKTFCAAVTAQLLTAACIDQFGWFSVPINKLDWQKMAGVFVLLIGMYLVVKK